MWIYILHQNIICCYAFTIVELLYNLPNVLRGYTAQVCGASGDHHVHSNGPHMNLVCKHTQKKLSSSQVTISRSSPRSFESMLLFFLSSLSSSTLLCRLFQVSSFSHSSSFKFSSVFVILYSLFPFPDLPFYIYIYHFKH